MSSLGVADDRRARFADLQRKLVPAYRGLTPEDLSTSWSATASIELDERTVSVLDEGSQGGARGIR